MTDIQLEIEGEGAVAATEELLQTPGVSGNWTPASEEMEKAVHESHLSQQN